MDRRRLVGTRSTFDMELHRYRALIARKTRIFRVHRYRYLLTALPVDATVLFGVTSAPNLVASLSQACARGTSHNPRTAVQGSARSSQMPNTRNHQICEGLYCSPPADA